MSENLKSSWPNFISNPPGSTHSTTPCSGHQTVHNGKCTMQSTDTHCTNNTDHTPHWTLDNLHCTVRKAVHGYKVQSVHCTVIHTAQCYTLHNAKHYTLHNALHTVHCTLHTAHYTTWIPRVKDDKTNLCDFWQNRGKRWEEALDFPNIWQRSKEWIIEFC